MSETSDWTVNPDSLTFDARSFPENENTNQRRRKNASTACDRCKQRKIRCDDQFPSCATCSKFNSYCSRNKSSPQTIKRQKLERAAKELGFRLTSDGSQHGDDPAAPSSWGHAQLYQRGPSGDEPIRSDSDVFGSRFNVGLTPGLLQPLPTFQQHPPHYESAYTGTRIGTRVSETDQDGFNLTPRTPPLSSFGGSSGIPSITLQGDHEEDDALFSAAQSSYGGVNSSAASPASLSVPNITSRTRSSSLQGSPYREPNVQSSNDTLSGRAKDVVTLAKLTLLTAASAIDASLDQTLAEGDEHNEDLRAQSETLRQVVKNLNTLLTPSETTSRKRKASEMSDLHPHPSSDNDSDVFSSDLSAYFDRRQ